MTKILNIKNIIITIGFLGAMLLPGAGLAQQAPSDTLIESIPDRAILLADYAADGKIAYVTNPASAFEADPQEIKFFDPATSAVITIATAVPGESQLFLGLTSVLTRKSSNPYYNEQKTKLAYIKKIFLPSPSIEIHIVDTITLNDTVVVSEPGNFSVTAGFFVKVGVNEGIYYLLGNTATGDTSLRFYKILDGTTMTIATGSQPGGPLILVPTPLVANIHAEALDTEKGQALYFIKDGTNNNLQFRNYHFVTGIDTLVAIRPASNIYEAMYANGNTEILVKETDTSSGDQFLRSYPVTGGSPTLIATGNASSNRIESLPFPQKVYSSPKPSGDPLPTNDLGSGYEFNGPARTAFVYATYSTSLNHYHFPTKTNTPITTGEVTGGAGYAVSGTRIIYRAGPLSKEIRVSDLAGTTLLTLTDAKQQTGAYFNPDRSKMSAIRMLPGGGQELYSLDLAAASPTATLVKAIASGFFGLSGISLGGTFWNSYVVGDRLVYGYQLDTGPKSLEIFDGGTITVVATGDAMLGPNLRLLDFDENYEQLLYSKNSLGSPGFGSPGGGGIKELHNYNIVTGVDQLIEAFGSGIQLFSNFYANNDGNIGYHLFDSNTFIDTLKRFVISSAVIDIIATADENVEFLETPGWETFEGVPTASLNPNGTSFTYNRITFDPNPKADIHNVVLDGAAPVDTTPPTTNLTAKDDQLNLDVAQDETTDSPISITYTFDGTDDTTPVAQLTFQCSLDGAAFTACSSPKTYPDSDLPLGAHSFQVRAKDQANNVDATPASHSFIVSDDIVAPLVDTFPTKMPVVLGGCATDGNALTSNYPNCLGQISSTSGGKTFGEPQTFQGIQTVDAVDPLKGLTVTSVITGSKFKVCASGFLATPNTNQTYTCGGSLEAIADAANVGDSTILAGPPNSTAGPAIKVNEPPGQTVTIDDVNDFHLVSTPISNTKNIETEILQELGAPNTDTNQRPLYSVRQTAGTDMNVSQNRDGSTQVSVSLTSVGSATIFANNGQTTLTSGQSAVVDTFGRLDLDNDGVFDDACPNTAGKPEWQGCPFGDKNIIDLHIVNLGGGASTKSRLAGAEVRVFDRNNSNFQAIARSKNPDGSLYGVIYETDAGRVGACVTGSDGICIAGEETIGDYLVIVKYFDSQTGKTVYIGRPKSPADFKDTDGDGLGDLATKDFQVIKTVKKDGFIEYRGGSKIVVTGSMLEVILPESAVWEGASSIYPFIFTSDSDWTVDVCAEVPQGYTMVGVYDENGNLVPSSGCVQSGVANTTKIVAFEVKETGSPEPSFSANLKLKNPKGKVTRQTHRVSDLRKNTFQNKVAEAKKKTDVLKKIKKPAVLDRGSSIWALAKGVLDGNVSNDMLKKAIKMLANHNHIDIPEWGISNGGRNARKLLAGTLIDLTPLRDFVK